MGPLRKARASAAHHSTPYSRAPPAHSTPVAQEMTHNRSIYGMVTNYVAKPLQQAASWLWGGRAQPIQTQAAILLSLIHISEPTRLLSISYAVFCLKKKKKPMSTQKCVYCYIKKKKVKPRKKHYKFSMPNRTYHPHTLIAVI
eukprot:TRINITY_DN23592_c0_g1_i1.p1 TRINITY_DN23592_c0_g1~~TRINITY_DN23592_c0_g1_i1.p1  ORF type:complete len:143 (-),score=11.81 TRINITY_DN23592_c0_g1_i1:3-431(-)